MGQLCRTSGGKLVALAAAYLHAFVLMVSLVLVPADPLFKTFENVTTLALTDASVDDNIEDAKIDGDDLSVWTLSQRARVSLRDGQRRCHSQDAPRASGCGRSFHARGPPASMI
jgi:hypothetical protein